MDPYITTIHGKKIDLISPSPSDIDIYDIAHALSMVCRFGGHTRHHYSVAQHSVYVSKLVPPSLALVGLLHDAAEAYLGDMVSPLKNSGLVHSYTILEDRFVRAIAKRYRLPVASFSRPAIRKADAHMLSLEVTQLIPESWFSAKPVRGFETIKIEKMTQTEAKNAFLERFEHLADPATILPLTYTF